MTQVPMAELVEGVAVADAHHEPLGFARGAFWNAQVWYPIVDYEAFSMVITCQRLEYLLCEGLYTAIIVVPRTYSMRESPASPPYVSCIAPKRIECAPSQFKYMVVHLVAGTANDFEISCQVGCHLPW